MFDILIEGQKQAGRLEPINREVYLRCLASARQSTSPHFSLASIKIEPPCARARDRELGLEVGLKPQVENRPGMANSPFLTFTLAARRLLQSNLVPVARPKPLKPPPIPSTTLVQARRHLLTSWPQVFPLDRVRSPTAEVRNPCLEAAPAPLICTCFVTPS